MTFEKLENIAIVLAAMATVALSRPLSLPVAFAQTKPAVELQAAITKEQVDGDIKTAIAAYQKIAADKSAPRDVRAKALLHLAGCYEKLGQQAQSVYQQIVRDFADQPAAVQARARLAVLKQDDHPAAPATMTQRRIQTLGPGMGPGDTDGHRGVYWSDATGELIYGDLAGKSKRLVFKAKPMPGFWPSRDFSIVGLQFQSKPNQPGTLAVVNTDGTGYREIARLDVPLVCGPSWSWDNRYFLCSQSQQGAMRLLRISVSDGQIRELLSLKTGTVKAATFSPDGRFVAYQVAPSSAADPVARICVLSVEGGEPQVVYEERVTTDVFSQLLQPLKLLDWTADGRYLSIACDRTGKAALHLLPIRDGKSAGVPVFLRYGDFEEGVTTASGGLVYRSVKPGGGWAIYLASLDTNSRPSDWKRLDLRLGNATNPWPKWSGDSHQIAYAGRNEDARQTTTGDFVRLHNLSVREDREIYRGHGHTLCTWAVQQPKLFCSDRAYSTDVVSIAVDSGEIARLHTFTASRLVMVYPSRDDRALYMVRRGDVLGGGELLRWEIATGQETILERFPSESFGFVSQDERWQLRLEKQNIDIRPIAGGDWKPLVSLSTGTGPAGWPPWLVQFNATPDGNWLLYHDVDTAGKHSLFRVATAGGKPERLGDFPTNSRGGTLEISPDGRKIMVSANEYSDESEFWSLENFVPPAPKP